MRVLVTGAKGQLGSDLLCELSNRNIDAIGIDIDDLDITDTKATKEVIEKINADKKLDAIIHCAAYTAVDAAQDNEALVTKINADGTKNIAEVAKALDLSMMYISTDYVFDGEGERPWEPDDQRAPLNIYGMAKYKGELYVEELLEKYFIVRISWVFGLHGNNFIKTMLRLGKERGAVSVVNDQIGSPTYTPDLSRLLADMILTDKYGRYHATNEGLCSWYEFACEIFKQAKLDVKVTPVSSDAFPVKAKRPHNSRMDKSKLTENGFELLPGWQDALSRYLSELEKN